jgi:hypothetical protein
MQIKETLRDVGDDNRKNESFFDRSYPSWDLYLDEKEQHATEICV